MAGRMVRCPDANGGGDCCRGSWPVAQGSWLMMGCVRASVRACAEREKAPWPSAPALGLSARVTRCRARPMSCVTPPSSPAAGRVRSDVAWPRAGTPTPATPGLPKPPVKRAGARGQRRSRLGTKAEGRAWAHHARSPGMGDGASRARAPARCACPASPVLALSLLLGGGGEIVRVREGAVARSSTGRGEVG